MAIISLLSRLKVLTSCNRIIQSALIKPNTEMLFLTKTRSFMNEKRDNWSTEYRFQDIKNCLDNILRYESKEKLPMMNGERNRYVNNHEYCGDMKMYAERRAFLFNSGSSIFLQFPLAPIYHSWKFSNKFCPSAKYHSSCIQKSMLKFYSSMKNPSYEKSLCKDLWKTEDLCKAKFYSKNIRNYSSSKESSCNKSKLKECDKIKLETLAKQEIPKCCTKDPYACKKPEHIQECVKPITKCLPSVGDTPFICTSTPCPSIEDYCPPEVYTHEEKIWQILTCIGLLSVVIMSCYVYNKSKDWDKEPRPEFRDVPYLRRIVKPFPWGDGKHTLFHNPARNPISPHGYETEDPSIKKK